MGDGLIFLVGFLGGTVICECCVCSESREWKIKPNVCKLARLSFELYASSALAYYAKLPLAIISVNNVEPLRMEKFEKPGKLWNVAFLFLQS